MIHVLRRKMVGISALSLSVVFLGIFIAIGLFSNYQLNTTMDMLTDRITSRGVFMPFDEPNPPPRDRERFPGFFTEETPYSTRFFLVRVDESGEFMGENLQAIFAVGSEAAREYAKEALGRGKARGWADHYRYKVVDEEEGKLVVFVDGGMNRYATETTVFISATVLLGSLLIVMLLILLLSKRAVRPMAESYEKQKQFVTDANHELKTPLTLILTNLDILESELGRSEWIDDIRSEGRRMSGLVEQLTALSRLDEEGDTMAAECFSLSDVCGDSVSEFYALAESKGLCLTSRIQQDLSCYGDEAAIRRLLAILLDNAVKYCDREGSISLVAERKWHTQMVVENSFSRVDALELERLFDRFYRADKARTAGNSFGIGLSLAKSIAEKHHGDIKAYKAGPGRIGFRVTIR